MEVFPPPQGPAPCSSAGGGRRTRAPDPAPEAPPTGPTGPASPAGLFFFFFFGAKSLLVILSGCLGILPETRARSAGAVSCSAVKAQGCAGPRLPADSPGPGEEEEGLAMQKDAAAPGKMAAAKSGAGGASQPA